MNNTSHENGKGSHKFISIHKAFWVLLTIFTMYLGWTVNNFVASGSEPDKQKTNLETKIEANGKKIAANGTSIAVIQEKISHLNTITATKEDVAVINANIRHVMEAVKK